MARALRVAVAQSGPIPDVSPKCENVARLVAMLRSAADRGAEVVVFTECALTAFFPHWAIDRPEEIDAYCERSMPNQDVEPLFAEARRLGVGFCLGYAELAVEGGEVNHYNSCVLVSAEGKVLGKYRKTHLPGYYVPDHNPEVHEYQNLEKRYFKVGNLGWQVFDTPWDARVGMMICNDRRWAEPWRVMGLLGAECVMLGYNTPTVGVTGGISEPPHLGMFQNHLSLMAGAYQNATWVCAAAKAGQEEGVHQMGGSCIVAPTGEIVAQATTEADEVIYHDLDLDMCARTNMSKDSWAAARQPQYYQLISRPIGSTTATAPGMTAEDEQASKAWRRSRAGHAKM